ncbi:MAG: 4Fe-4S binding protein [Candidatus Omnitrophota bacterium]
MKKWVVIRRASQIFFLFLFIYILWSTTYPLKGVISPEVLFKIDPLVILLTSLSERIILPGIVLSIFMILLTLAFGRFFCGWVCPLGAAIDFAAFLKRGHFRKEEDTANARLRKPKFFILGIIALSALFGLQIAWVFDPVVIMARFVSLNLIPLVIFAMDRFFGLPIRGFNLCGAFYDFYRGLKSSLLGVNVYYFSHSVIIFVFFLAIFCAGFLIKRIWCRALCPLGAIYALAAKPALLNREVKECLRCGKCKSVCRMGAIKNDASYLKGECILCMDCVYDCPDNITRFTLLEKGRSLTGFGFRKPDKIKNAAINKDEKGISRRNFILLGIFSFFAVGFRKRGFSGERSVIRPPAAIREDEFVDRCLRCGNCMKVCSTNGLQPVMFQSGLEGIWTPQLLPEIGYCDYNCALCGNVCPTGAIRRISLAEKRETKLGLAKVNCSICLAWAEKQQCLVCQEYCPVLEKAIKIDEAIIDGITVLRPVVDKNLCVGCGICQNKCPVRPVRAIKVSPL